jgi:hypothetical protein
MLNLIYIYDMKFYGFILPILILISCLPTNEEKARREQFVLDSITDVTASQMLRKKNIQDSVNKVQLKEAAIADSLKNAIRIEDSLNVLPKSKKRKAKSKRH